MASEMTKKMQMNCQQKRGYTLIRTGEHRQVKGGKNKRQEV